MSKVRVRQGPAYFIATYLPPNTPAYDDSRVDYWEALDSISQGHPNTSFYAVMGDFNTRLKGRLRGETDHIGPYNQGGPLAIKKTSAFLTKRVMGIETTSLIC